jgi:hypothetical protein
MLVLEKAQSVAEEKGTPPKFAQVSVTLRIRVLLKIL